MNREFCPRFGGSEGRSCIGAGQGSFYVGCGIASFVGASYFVTAVTSKEDSIVASLNLYLAFGSDRDFTIFQGSILSGFGDGKVAVGIKL